MPMRHHCKHFESRTYPTGDTVRKCNLDLAPEAPWRCPEQCPRYSPRLADVDWQHGSLVIPPTPDAPSSVGEDPSIAELLEAARNVVNEAAPDVVAQLEAEQADRPFWKRIFRRGRSS